MNEKEIEKQAERLSEIRELVAGVFLEKDMNNSEVVSLLCSMLVQVVSVSGIPPMRMIEVIARGFQAHDEFFNDEEDEEGKGNLQWLN